MSDETGIYVSINPNSTFKIVQGTKKYEFRNYIPKSEFKYLYVYVTAPESEIRYIIEIGEIIKYPNILPGDSDGVHEFNMGVKSKYAYPVIKVYELVNPISLRELRKKYNFSAPQAFAYDNAYPILTNCIKSQERKLLVSN